MTSALAVVPLALTPGEPRLAQVRRGSWAGVRPTRLTLLGGFELPGPADLPPAATRLVALLALRGPLPRCVVAGLLWPESDETRAGGALRTTVWRLGRCTPGLVRGDVVLALQDDLDVDVHRMATSARALLRDDRHRPVDTGALLDGGDLLPGWVDEWVLDERDELRELRVTALEVLSGRASVRRRHALATEAARAAIRLDPLRESAHRALIRAQLAEGNRARAVATYRRLAELLKTELGFGPAEETRRLLALDQHEPVRRYSSGG